LTSDERHLTPLDGTRLPQKDCRTWPTRPPVWQHAPPPACGWSPSPAAQGRIRAAGTVTALTQVVRREIIAGFAVTGDGETRDEDYDQECGQALVHVSHPKHSRPWREEMTAPKILSTRGADKALENRRFLEDGIPVGIELATAPEWPSATISTRPSKTGTVTIVTIGSGGARIAEVPCLRPFPQMVSMTVLCAEGAGVTRLSYGQNR
jgi:hypothetical protein